MKNPPKAEKAEKTEKAQKAQKENKVRMEGVLCDCRQSKIYLNELLYWKRTLEEERQQWAEIMQSVSLLTQRTIDMCKESDKDIQQLLYYLSDVSDKFNWALIFKLIKTVHHEQGLALTLIGIYTWL